MVEYCLPTPLGRGSASSVSVAEAPREGQESQSFGVGYLEPDIEVVLPMSATRLKGSNTRELVECATDLDALGIDVRRWDPSHIS